MTDADGAAAADALLAQAASAAADGDVWEAERLLDLAAEAAPAGQLLTQRGALAAARAEWRLADRLLRAGIAADDGNAEAMRGLAELCESRGDLVQAEHWWQRLASRDGLDPQAGGRAEQVRRLRRRPPVPAADAEVWSQPDAAERPYAGLRVLAITDLFHPSVGGTEVLTESAAVGLLALGAEVEVATRMHADRSLLEHRGIRIHQLDESRIAGDLAAVVQSGNYDATLTFTGAMSEFFKAAMELGRGGRAPRSVVVPCVNPQIYEQLRRDGVVTEYSTLLTGAEVVCYSARTGVDHLLLDEIGIDGGYVPNAVAYREGTPGFRERHGFRAGDPLLLMVANFWPEKNHIEFLREFRDAPEDWQLALVGGRSRDFPWLLDEALEFIADDPRVTFVGPLAPEEVASAMDECSVVLLPSWAEATPLVLLEAMSHRVPWVASPDTGGAHDYSGGLMAPVDQFLDAIGFLLQKPVIASDLSAAGRSHWERCYTVEAMAGQYAGLLAGESPQPLQPSRESVQATERARADYYEWRLTRASAELAATVIGTRAKWPTVTCVMPALNAERFIGEAIAGVMAQDYPPELLDLVVIDDGSSDGTAAAVESAAEAHPGRIRLLRQQQSGAAAAVNAGLALAQGELIALCDADDVWLPHKLFAQAGAFHSRPGLTLSYTDMEQIDAGGEVLARSLALASGEPLLRRQTVDELARQRFQLGSSVVMRASAIKALDESEPYPGHSLALQAAAAGQVRPFTHPFVQSRQPGGNLVLGRSTRGGVLQLLRNELQMGRLALTRGLEGKLRPETLAFIALNMELRAREMLDVSGRLFTEMTSVSPEQRQRAAELIGFAEKAPAAEEALRGFALAMLLDPFNGSAWRGLRASAGVSAGVIPAWMRL